MKEAKWLSPLPKGCDICGQPFGTHFIDGATIYSGLWALMCETCHAKVGKGLGCGKGQKYLTATKELVEGGNKILAYETVDWDFE